jgi:hypothetical protein
MHQNPTLEEAAGKVLDVFLTYVRRGGLEAMRRQAAWDEGRDPTERPRGKRSRKGAT